MHAILRSLPVLALTVAAVFALGCESVPDADASILEIRAASIDPMDGWTESDAVIGGSRVWISPDITVDASMVLLAEPIKDGSGRNAVLVDLDDAGTEALRRLTTAWISRPVAVFIDGRIVTTPILQSELSRKFVVASAEITEEQAEDLARRLRDQD
jgi:preprotein translocase subunit SecD